MDSREEEDLASGVAGPAVTARRQIGAGEESTSAPEHIATAPETEGKEAAPEKPVEQPAANKALNALWQSSVVNKVDAAAMTLHEKKPNPKLALRLLQDANQGVASVGASYERQPGKEKLDADLMTEQRDIEMRVAELAPHAGMGATVAEIAENLDYTVPELKKLGLQLT